MNLWKSFWADEQGMILSAETVLLGTVGVVGATVGLSAVARSVDGEMTDLARSFRSLDQSYHYEGTRHGSAWTAGSNFTQEPVEVSLKKLDAEVERLHQVQQQAEQKQAEQKQKIQQENPAEPAKKPETPKKKKPKKDNTSTVPAPAEVDLDSAA